jgi:hypothetical protein
VEQPAQQEVVGTVAATEPAMVPAAAAVLISAAAVQVLPTALLPPVAVAAEAGTAVLAWTVDMEVDRVLHKMVSIAEATALVVVW